MNYLIFTRDRRQWCNLFFTWLAFCLMFGFLFYKNVVGVIILIPLLYLYEKYDRNKQIEKRKVVLSDQFIEALHIMSASLQAGNSFEMSVRRCAGEILTLYPQNSYIVGELEAMKRGLECNVNVEDLFIDLGKRSGVHEINEFAEVCQVSKRAGGNIVKVMAHTVNVIDSRKSMEREIRTITSEKRIEGHIMDILLPGLLLYLDLAMPDMMEVMYSGLMGRFIMTVILALYCISVFFMEKITDIKV